MKIVFLSFYSGIVYRGVETYVHELASNLSQLGHDVTVYQGGEDVYKGNYKTVSIPSEVNFLRKGNVGVFVNQFIGANADRKFTLKVLKSLDPDTDIVVATNNRFQSLLCRIWCLGKKTKLVISGQGGPGIDERIALWCFPHVFVPLSEYQKNWAEKANPFVRVSKPIHNGVSLDKFSKKAKKIQLNLKGKIVLCSAAFWPIMKGQNFLIKAVSKLDNVSLVLAGSGEGELELKRLCNKYLKDRHLIKSFKYEEMPNVYASCDLFSFPTWKVESFGIAMVEAMASGLAVVASDDPIRREIVGEAGLFVDRKKINEYSYAIKKALNTDWGNKPLDQAKKFDWRKIARQYEDLFKSI